MGTVSILAKSWPASSHSKLNPCEGRSHASPPATPPPLSLDRGRHLVSMWFGRSPTRLVPTTRRNRRFDMPRIAQTGQVGRLSLSLLSPIAHLRFQTHGTSRWLERRFSKYAHANATTFLVYVTCSPHFLLDAALVTPISRVHSLCDRDVMKPTNPLKCLQVLVGKNGADGVSF